MTEVISTHENIHRFEAASSLTEDDISQYKQTSWTSEIGEGMTVPEPGFKRDWISTQVTRLNVTTLQDEETFDRSTFLSKCDIRTPVVGVCG